MPDEETTEPAPQTSTEPQTPTQPETTPEPVENPVSEPNPAPANPQEPIPEVSNQPEQPNSAEVPSEPVEAQPSPEEAIPVKDANSANEPLNQAPEPLEPATEPNPENPNITVEKHGNDVTITEVMEPKSETETQMAQLPPNEPLGEVQDEQRKQNLKLANETRQEKKREKIDKILEMFSESKEITNDEVEKLLHVSDATATRYLETLEKENKIKQVGKTGKGVKYEKI